jgi:hypothetical protein
MNNKEFFADIERTRNSADPDYEARHASEDRLVYDFIEFVASEGGTHSLKAKLLLEMLDDDVPRWFA